MQNITLNLLFSSLMRLQLRHGSDLMTYSVMFNYMTLYMHTLNKSSKWYIGYGYAWCFKKDYMCINSDVILIKSAYWGYTTSSLIISSLVVNINLSVKRWQPTQKDVLSQNKQDTEKVCICHDLLGDSFRRLEKMH